MWKQFKLSAASCFSFVETAGLSYAARLLADSLGWHQPSRHPDEAGLAQDERAKWQVALSDTLDLESRVQLAASILAGLGLKDRIAPLVLLVGHGSSTTNNPHRAGLDCGACAGQTGEVNARAAAALLNDPEVRAALATRGRALPADCRFVPALHDTTCDQLRLLETLPAPVASSGLEEALRAALERAGELVRLERAVRLEPEAGAVAAPHLPGRGRDWSQVRPEWALAGNAAFIAAPRRLSRGLDLAGRAFLHEYEAAEDPGFAVLTTLMTAPLIVANWINMQYYASTVDNQRQGCGNKALHNVVGGTLGVLEGNGGDLRIGLSEQSLRDVEGRLQHEPLRLCAIIAAPREAMDAIIAAHAPLRRLIDGRWLSLCQLCDDGALYERFAAGDWRPMA